MFTPSNVSDVRRRFYNVVRKAAQRAEAAAKYTGPPLKPPAFSITRHRRSA